MIKPASLKRQISSGGVIYKKIDDTFHVALISVKDGKFWSLPKGLIDKGETPEMTAVREVREESGLARSSRNERLSDEDRGKAEIIIESLREAKLAFKRGERNAARLAEIVRNRLESEPLVTIDYVAIVDRETMQPIEMVGDNETLIAAAVEFAGVRLIDNVILNRVQ